MFNDFLCKFNGYVNIILVHEISFAFLHKTYIHILRSERMSQIQVKRISNTVLYTLIY